MKGKQVEGPLRVSKRTFLSKVAARAGVPVAVVHQVYRAMVAELLEIARRGDSLMLTGFGRFYPHRHHGHRVQFATEDDGEPRRIDDYTVLKFSATRDVNKSLDD